MRLCMAKARGLTSLGLRLSLPMTLLALVVLVVELLRNVLSLALLVTG